MTRKTQVVSVRLHSGDKAEAEALSYLATMESHGFNKRQIIADALVRASCNDDVPQYFRVANQMVTPALMQDMLRDFARYILDNMPSVQGKQQTSSFGIVEEADDESAILDNLIASWGKRNND